jgi:hypothetical protein
MYLKSAILVALGIAFAAADEIHLVNCQNTSPRLPRDEYTVMAVSPAAALYSAG